MENILVIYDGTNGSVDFDLLVSAKARTNYIIKKNGQFFKIISNLGHHIIRNPGIVFYTFPVKSGRPMHHL